ncbi:MAG: Fic family protein [Firmicutes bacterium]|nr:Fic family protein [Bacillota bacterium]
MQYEPLNKIFYKNYEAYQSIYQKRFNNESAYRYNFAVGDDQAFVIITLEILNLITDILQLDKRLLKAIQSVPPIAIDQFTKKCIVEEIQLTNEIEGVQSTRKEIREVIQADEAKKKSKRMYGLVQKYMMLSQGEKISLRTCRDIRTLYDEFVLAEVKTDNPANVPDGEIFRKDMVEVVSPSQKVIHKGLYPEDKIISAMTATLDVLHNDQLNYFVNIAVFHYMFGYIHPFYDGNGRMSRFISSYLLNQRLEAVVGFGLSTTIKNKIKKYYDLFKDTNDYRNKGDLTPFVIGFLEFIAEAIETLCKTIEEKSEQFTFYIDKVDHYADNNKALRDILFVLVQISLFEDEGIGISELAEAADMGKSTVRMWLKKITGDVLISQQSGRTIVYRIDLDVMARIK